MGQTCCLLCKMHLGNLQHYLSFTNKAHAFKTDLEQEYNRAVGTCVKSNSRRRSMNKERFKAPERRRMARGEGGSCEGCGIELGPYAQTGQHSQQL